MPDASRCARAVVAELLGQGVREVVLAPGSRSAPLAFELFEADQRAALRLHVRIDERSAAFLALGLAKASGTPVAVVTTSGTAVANLHPAVLEAAHSHLPLVLLTADRPGSMLDTGANQTTSQRSLFNDHVRAAAHLEDQVGAEPSWRFQVARLVAAATGARSLDPGPVHLNVGLSEPLVPEPALPQPGPRPALVVEPARRERAPVRLPSGPRTVVLVGDASASTGAEAAALASATGTPLLAEPSSNARAGAPAIATYRLLLETDLGKEVDRVVVFGHPTLSRPVSRLLQRPACEIVVVTQYATWTDPATSASTVADAVTMEAGDPEWLRRWQDADRALRQRLDSHLAAQGYFSGPAMAAALWEALGPDDTLVVGASHPIRDLDLTAVKDHPPAVYANRGLAGIDGTVSTAIGVALAVGRPCHALLGDVTFLHDSTGLVLGPDEPRPDLRIVVANDDGGSIFATLEPGRPAHSRQFERIFGTPHGADIAALAAAHRLPYARAETSQELADLVRNPPAGIEVVEAVLDRRHRRSLDAEITGLAATPAQRP